MKLNPYERREDIDLGIALIYRLLIFFSKIVMTLVVTVIFYSSLLTDKIYSRWMIYRFFSYWRN